MRHGEYGIWGGILLAGGQPVARFQRGAWSANRHPKPLVFAEISRRLHAGLAPTSREFNPDIDYDALAAAEA